ncbi:MAG: DUF3866 family protein [Clostridia bacterium]|nr:MAG: DUF3866 family protein [Clostridia bacterium]
MALSCERGNVIGVISHRRGLTESLVGVAGRVEKALGYDSLTGSVEPGDEVLMNTTAVRLGLGTGGYHFIMANLSTAGMTGLAPGRIMKLRYTPLQLQVEAAEERQPEAFGPEAGLSGMPVVCCSLHSQLPGVVFGARAAAGSELRLVYIMTDGAALPLTISRLVAWLEEDGLLSGTITAGQAFGGEVEAVNLYSALLAARLVLRAEVAVVAMGPGIVGTGSAWGTTALEQGEAVNAAHILGGQPVAVPRLSFADPRPRHRGLSHHTLTALGRVALTPATLVLPRLDGEKAAVLRYQLEESGLASRHLVVEEDGAPGLELLAESSVPVTTMGRGLEEEREFFLASTAAGQVAARLAREGRAVPTGA